MIKTASGGGEYALLSASAVQFMQLMLADRTSLRAHPAIVYFNQYGFGAAGSGSGTGQYTTWGLDGYDTMGSVNEGSQATETALTNALKTITTAKKQIRRDLSDEARTLDATGQLNPLRLAQDGFGAAMMTLTNLLAGLMSGFSNQVGTTGVAFTHDTWLAAQAKLQDANVPGPYLALMAPTHFSAWQQDLETRGGLTQWSPAAAEMQVLKGYGYKGTYNGVDVYVTDGVPTSGSDRISGMFGRGAVGFGEQEIVYGPEADIIVQAGPIASEVQRIAGAYTQIYTTYHVGVTEIEDGRGVGMLALE